MFANAFFLCSIVSRMFNRVMNLGNYMVIIDFHFFAGRKMEAEMEEKRMEKLRQKCAALFFECSFIIQIKFHMYVFFININLLCKLFPTLHSHVEMQTCLERLE